LINLTLGNVSIMNIKNSSGIFIGEKNSLKNFDNESVVNEVVGVLSGNENLITENHWVKTKEKWEDE
jgi:hypothetical protein